MAFRIGRKFAQHTYPEPRRGAGGTSDEFARNFAVGPGDDTDTTSAIPVPWSDVDVGSPGNSVSITPETTGVVRVMAVLTLKNPSGGDTVSVGIGVLVGGVLQPFPSSESVVIPTNSTLVVPVLAELTGLTIGVPVQVGIQVEPADSATVRIVEESSSIEVQEVQESTG